MQGIFLPTPVSYVNLSPITDHLSRKKLTFFLRIVDVWKKCSRGFKFMSLAPGFLDLLVVQPLTDVIDSFLDNG